MATLTMYYEWESEQTDCRKCSICEDMIFSDMWRLVFGSISEPQVKVTESINDPSVLNADIYIPRRKSRKTDTVICDSCKQMI